MITFHIITIFPHIFESYFNESIINRAKKENFIQIKIYNLRNWTSDVHKTIDDTPYGGGAGMIMKIEPLYKAIQDIKKETSDNHKIFLMSAKGKKWTQKTAHSFLDTKDIILICGRYEGVDDRINNFIDGEISIGDYVLTGGEIPAMAVIDSVSRLIPGVLGNKESLKDESHSIKNNLEYPQYTRPEIFKTKDKEYTVPPVLLSGNHQKIEEWKKNNSSSTI